MKEVSFYQIVDTLSKEKKKNLMVNLSAHVSKDTRDRFYLSWYNESYPVALLRDGNEELFEKYRITAKSISRENGPFYIREEYHHLSKELL